MLFDRGANLLLTPSDVDSAVRGSGAAHAHLSGYALLDPRTRPAGLHALRIAPQQRLTTSVDAASAAPLRVAGGAAFVDWVRGVDLLLANLEEALALLDADAGVDPAAAALALTEVGRHVVVKLGSGGAMLAGVDGASASVTAEPASVVEPTGAGDAFAAGFLASWLSGADTPDCLRAGSRLGARAASTIGGRP
jgi:sugar/nucleoside kinase (ribokinase family)